jgi:uncharacterized protein (DUF433 family)
MYSASEIARWAKTTPQTARRWLVGYYFPSNAGRRWSPAVTAPQGKDNLWSFEDLIEVAAVAAARREGVPMPRIRKAVEYAVERLDIARPLLSERWRTDGHDLFALEDTNFSRMGQRVWSFAAEALRDVEYGNDLLVAKWWPAGKDTGVLVDPQVNFGRPIVASIGVRTETIADRFYAGATMEDVGAEYDISALLVQEAVRFENRAAAVAA